MQRAFLSGPEALPRASAVSTSVGHLLASARTAQSLVIHLQNDGPQGASDEVGSPGWTLATDPLPGEPVIRKRLDDGFVDTDLEDTLRQHRARTLVICGIQSEMCVAATARTAMAKGMSVILPRDAHATYPIPAQGPLAPPVPAQHVARVAEWSLGDEAVVVDTSDEVSFTRAAER